MKSPKIYAFIDSQNLNLSIKEINWDLDYKRFLIYLRDKYHTQKAFLFLGYVPENKRLYDYLSDVGYVIIFKPTLELNGVVKGNCDAELVLHCMIEHENYDKAIIVSGDGDFHCLIDYLIKKNKLAKVGIPNKKKYSSLLREFRHPYFFYISNLKDKLKK
ncbi:NYN domain-containing protein [Candidatus Gracilibacteria bacterium]|nr:NYN domain-containing protein [Candidatus Gracilibacteria bacterium]